MATNGLNTSEDAEMADCKVVTMMDVLREQQDFEEDANAVLGASDDKNCTYSKGYVKRQAIYACLTCCPEAVTDSMKRAGVCLACSLACHENHELVELYTKRNFRCDCGNPKFKQPCTFTPNKTDLNYDNKYNQNFSGLYCNCKRPYPDPEATEEEEMIQCIICEDWLHTNHLEATVPSNEQYAEMICKDCMEDIDFLHDYSDLVVNVEDKEIIVMDPDLDVTSIIKAKEAAKLELPNGNAESKDKDETVPENKDSNVEEAKSTDVEMAENKPSDEMTENKPEDSGDVKSSNNDADISEKSENKTEASQEANPDAAVAETKENEGDKKTEQKKDDNVEQEAKSGSEGTEKPEDPTTAESTEKPTEGETKTPEENTRAEPTEAESAQNKETTETGTADSLDKDVAKSEADSVTDTKDEAVTANADVSADTKMQEEEMKEETPLNGTSEKENDSPVDKVDHKRKLSEGDSELSPKKAKLETKPCVRPRGVKRVYKGSTFWPTTLRQKLCTCAECLSMYKDLAVLFLIDPEDTVTAYETLGKENDDAASSQYEKGLQALSSLDRVQQINALTEYNKMRDKLLDFLKSFKDRKEIVKEEDIKAFFAGMKPKREPDGVYFCR
ncbi:putative zinc finger in n-recognin (UBR box) domain-containing protein [Phthorimaea operculella]|nr:putative zinc finger in n-recognin (UBR box) domain-containing protein [Phthorimaea operculella]